MISSCRQKIKNVKKKNIIRDAYFTLKSGEKKTKIQPQSLAASVSWTASSFVGRSASRTNPSPGRWSLMDLDGAWGQTAKKTSFSMARLSPTG